MYRIFIKFRSGEGLEIKANKFAYNKPSKTPFWHLFIDDKPMIKVLQGQPVNLKENTTQFNDCVPTYFLFEEFPELDKEKPGMLVIDSVIVHTYPDVEK